MQNEEIKMEDHILKAARKIFTSKGFDGTSMQEIADEAGINKSLLHYYFRSKEKLFTQIFREAFALLIPAFGDIFMSDKTFYEKIEEFTDVYIQVMIDNPQIPAFVLMELNTNPGRLADLITGSGIHPELLLSTIKAEVDNGSIKPIDPRQLIVNMIALCIFPIAAKPLLMRVLFNNDEDAYQVFLEERKKEVPKFIINSLKK